MNTGLQKKLEHFCAYQERCRHDVLRKIAALQQAASRNGDVKGRGSVRVADFTQRDIIEVLDYLEKEKFIDDNRFARIFAISKLRQKQWGKCKIKVHLNVKGISAENIQDALNSLDDEEYESIRNKIISTKGEKAAFAHGF
jgi:regulatory protein